MNKSPAFQFYPDDFLGGTIDMTAQDVGCYVRLLCYQWSRGAIPSDRKVCDRIAGCKVSDSVIAKFPDFKNPRIESEREKQAVWREKSRQGGLKSAASRTPRVVQPPLQPNLQPPHKPNGQPTGQPNGNIPLSSLQSPSPESVEEARAPFPPDAHIPTLDEVKTRAAMIGVTPESAERFFQYHDDNNLWTNRNQILINWPAKLKSWGDRDRQMPATKTRTGQQEPVKPWAERTVYDCL